MSETVPLDQFIATSNAALTYKAERDALAAQVSTLRELLAVLTESHARVEDAINDSFARSGMPPVPTSPAVVEARAVLAALASTPGDPDAST